MTDRHSSQPDEEPPATRGPRAFSWLLSSVAGLVGLAFLVLAVVIALIVLVD